MAETGFVKTEFESADIKEEWIDENLDVKKECTDEDESMDVKVGEYNLTFSPPQGGGGKKSAQGREFKVYKEREGKKRKEKMKRKERGEERKIKRGKKRK